MSEKSALSKIAPSQVVPGRNHLMATFGNTEAEFVAEVMIRLCRGRSTEGSESPWRLFDWNSLIEQIENSDKDTSPLLLDEDHDPDPTIVMQGLEHLAKGGFIVLDTSNPDNPTITPTDAFVERLQAAGYVT